MMKYKNVTKAIFIDRPNRFIANVLLPDGSTAKVHVKNTGRCSDILAKGNTVFLERSDDPPRKTSYDLIAAEKPGSVLFNIDSQATNRVMSEWLAGCVFDYVKPEYRYEDSRIDFYMKRGQDEFLLEVKGCTLEKNGTGYFPDAPTKRGTKHLRGLTEAAKKGLHTGIAFVMQSECMHEVLPNEGIDPAFAAAFREAEDAGVAVFFCSCRVTPDSLEITSVIPSAGTAADHRILDTFSLSEHN